MEIAVRTYLIAAGMILFGMAANAQGFDNSPVSVKGLNCRVVALAHYEKGALRPAIQLQVEAYLFGYAHAVGKGPKTIADLVEEECRENSGLNVFRAFDQLSIEAD